MTECLLLISNIVMVSELIVVNYYPGKFNLRCFIGFTSEDLLQVPTSGNFLDLLPGFTSEKVVYAIFSFRAPEIFQNCLMDKAAMP